MDNVYANSEESTVGHKITAGGYVNDYTQRYANSKRGRKGNPDIFPIGFPPNAFVFDQAVRQNIPFRVYGELGAGNQPFGDDGRPTFDAVLANTDAAYPSQVAGSCQPAGQNLPLPNSVRCTADSGEVTTPPGPGTAGPPATQSRIRTFAAQFPQQVAAGTVPRFNYFILFNDHTDGSTPGTYTPKAMMADNDLALGQLVELVSQSSIWNESAILVVEDDSQSGIDSVDAHRMPAFVISPWAKRGGAVVSTRYDHYSFLRTAEMIVGLRPLSINDLLATPLYDAFISGSEQPDVDGTRYRAIQPQQSLTEVNPANAANAKLSAALPWDKPDYVPQELADRILWQSVFGAGSRPPAPGRTRPPSRRHGQTAPCGSSAAVGAPAGGCCEAPAARTRSGRRPPPGCCRSAPASPRNRPRRGWRSWRTKATEGQSSFAAVLVADLAEHLEVLVEVHVDRAAVLRDLDLVLAFLVVHLGAGDLAAAGVIERGRRGLVERRARDGHVVLVGVLVAAGGGGDRGSAAQYCNYSYDDQCFLHGAADWQEMKDEMTMRRDGYGIELALFAVHEDRRDRAVAGRLDHDVGGLAVGVDHHRLVLAVELEHRRRGVHAVARADAQRAVDLDADPVLGRELVGHGGPRRLAPGGPEAGALARAGPGSGRCGRGRGGPASRSPSCASCPCGRRRASRAPSPRRPTTTSGSSR